jgi:hypothetical protein
LKEEAIPAFHAAVDLNLNLQRRSRDGLCDTTLSPALSSQQLRLDVTEILGIG